MWLFRALLLLISTSGFAQIYSNEPLIREEISSGVTWEYYHFELDGKPLSINTIVFNPEKGKLQLGQIEDSLVNITNFPKENAIAAVNGSFFNMKDGGSVVFLQKGKFIVPSPKEYKYTDNGAVVISKKEVIIEARPEKGWKKIKKNQILSSGPLLINDGNLIELSEDKFTNNRHPRTAVAILPSGEVLLITIDGRNAKSVGISLNDLQAMFASLNCTYALNLDGGGSTSMWIKGRTPNGIVNYPSDNREFDHYGQRRVANILYIVPITD